MEALNNWENKMKLQANAGEMIYDFLTRASYTAYCSGNTVQAIHNTTRINVYPDSIIDDICDKFDMQRMIDTLKGN